MDRNRPLIGITAYEVPASFSHWHEMPAVMVPAAYSQSVAAAGGLPVVIPPVEGTAEALDQLQGLVLSGGSDLDAGLYGEQQHPDTLGVIAHRDRSEQELLAAALERDLPVLGICRGMQLLNVQCGGSLHQHLPEIVDGSLHKAAPGTFALHRVAIEPGSRLEALLGPEAEVHSCHHQAPDRIGEGLAVTARAPDGVVEGIELRGAVLHRRAVAPGGARRVRRSPVPGAGGRGPAGRRSLRMIDSTSCVALELVRAAPDATIALEQASPSLPCAVRDLRGSQITPDRCKPGLAASRRLEHLVLRP